MKPITEVITLFLKLGFIAFGGPVAHIAMMEEEVVKRRQWLDRQQFLDLVAATNLVPGPNSTEMAIHVGFLRAGWPGLILGGACFILPAALIVLVLAWLYERYGTLPQGQAFLYGIQPVIIAVIAQAIWRFGKTSLKDWSSQVVALLALTLVLSGVNEVLLLLAAGLLGMVWYGRIKTKTFLLTAIPPGLLVSAIPALSVIPQNPQLLLTLGLVFLKIGSILFGSGYVLVAFLQQDIVHRYGWLTQQQLLDAIAVGQFTPGPVLTTATFVGYQIAGLAGAIVSTLCIFLPAFIIVALTNPWIPRLRQSSLASGFLDGVNAAVVGFMAAVTLQIGRGALVDLPTILLAIGSAVALFWWNLNTTWLILAGGLVGGMIYLIR